MFCTRCGGPVQHDDRFCAACGVVLRRSPAGITPDPAAGGRPTAVVVSAVMLLVLCAGAGLTYWFRAVDRSPGDAKDAIAAGPALPVEEPVAVTTSRSAEPTPAPSSSRAPRSTVPAPSSVGSPAPGDFAALFNEVSSGVVMIRATSCDGEGVGSGFLVSPTEILTAAHVVRSAVSVAVVHDGLAYTARVAGLDRGTDVALLQVEGPLRGARVFDVSDALVRAGTAVAVIGHPLGDPVTITEGNVSRADDGLWPDVQLDVSVSPGNSGGPVVTDDGVVVAMLTAKDARAEGLAYAVRSDHITPVLNGSRALPAAAPAECASPLGPDYTEIPALPATDPLNEAIVDTFASYFGGINSGHYRSAYRQLSPRLRSGAGFQSFATGVSTSFDFDFEVRSVAVTERGAVVWLRFVSLQAPSMGPEGESCTQWSLDYELVWGTAARLLIDGVDPHDGDGHTPCE